MGMKTLKMTMAVATLVGGLGAAASAEEMTAATAGDARTKVATAVALANIAKADKDGEALLVATRMLATAGPVAVPGGELKDGKPTLFYDIAVLVDTIKDLGVDAAKADEVAKSAKATSARSDGYWYYSCDSYNNCQWIYAGW